MTKSEIISLVANKAGFNKKAAGGVLNASVGAILQALKEECRMRINHLGTFQVEQRKARAGVNPRTGAKITIPATKAPSFTPSFRASQALKDTVKDPRKSPERKK